MAKKEYVKEGLNAHGQEVPDPVPMAPPLGYQEEMDLAERIRQMVRSEHLRLAALQEGMEDFDEADDFEVGEDYDPTSPYEEIFDPVDHEARMRLRNEEHRAKVDALLSELHPPKEKDDGTASVHEGRGADVERGGKGSDSVGEGDADSVHESDDKRGLRKADRPAGAVKK